MFHPSRSTIRRTGRLLAPSMPVSSSAFPGRPPQPSWRIRSMQSDKRISGHMIAAAMMISVATIMPIRMPIRTVR